MSNRSDAAKAISGISGLYGTGQIDHPKYIEYDAKKNKSPRVKTLTEKKRERLLKIINKETPSTYEEMKQAQQSIRDDDMAIQRNSWIKGNK